MLKEETTRGESSLRLLRHIATMSADFTITARFSRCRVNDTAIAMSPEPDGKVFLLTFPSVNMPTITSIIKASESSASPDEVETSESSSPIIGLGLPPLTEGYVDAGFGSVFETVGFTGALILMSGTAIWWLCKK
jgi:hypothetical protein